MARRIEKEEEKEEMGAGSRRVHGSQGFSSPILLQIVLVCLEPNTREAAS